MFRLKKIFEQLEFINLVGLITAAMIFSSFIYDYNEVQFPIDPLHISVKLFVVIGILVATFTSWLSEENKIYTILLLLYLHGGFGTLYVDSAYHHAFNQGMALLLILSNNKIIKYYWQVVLLGLFLSIITLMNGAGFCYVKEYAGNPFSNYIHGTVIFGVMSLSAYYLGVLKNAKKFKEISKLASVGLRSKYLMHEIKNISLGSGSQDKSDDILNCIKLIVDDKLEKNSLNLNTHLGTIIDELSQLIFLSKVKIVFFKNDELDIEVDMQSLDIILKNILMNSIEHVDEFEDDKVVNIEIIQNNLIISNKCTHSSGTENYAEMNFTTKSSIHNKGIGINIAQELCQLNRIKYQSNVKDKTYQTTLSFINAV
jgi:hypothetical protein